MSLFASTTNDADATRGTAGVDVNDVLATRRHVRCRACVCVCVMVYAHAQHSSRYSIAVVDESGNTNDVSDVLTHLM
jgi:hypothetical protein